MSKRMTKEREAYFRKFPGGTEEVLGELDAERTAHENTKHENFEAHTRMEMRFIQELALERAAHAKTKAERDEWAEMNSDGCDLLTEEIKICDAWRTAYWEIRTVLIQADRIYGSDKERQTLIRAALAKNPPGERP